VRAIVSIPSRFAKNSIFHQQVRVEIEVIRARRLKGISIDSYGTDLLRRKSKTASPNSGLSGILPDQHSQTVFVVRSPSCTSNPGFFFRNLFRIEHSVTPFILKKRYPHTTPWNILFFPFTTTLRKTGPPEGIFLGLFLLMGIGATQVKVERRHRPVLSNDKKWRNQPDFPATKIYGQTGRPWSLSLIHPTGLSGLPYPFSR